MIDIALLLVAAFLLMLPLVPALTEWHVKRDVAPLRIIRTHDGNAGTFAARFRTYVRELQPYQHAAGSAADPSWVAVGRGGYPILDVNEYRKKRSDRGVLSEESIRLPDEFAFSREIYGGADVYGGKANRLRAVLAERNLYLGDDSIVTRWIHAEHVKANHGCRLAGRVSADVEILIATGCMFRRLNAPRILFGAGPWRKTETKGGYRADAAVPGKRALRARNGRVAPASRIDRNLLAQDAMRVGQAAEISGSLKSGDNLTIAANARVEGAVSCGRDLFIGRGCHIRGPVLAEGRILIGPDCCIGDPGHPTTVSAPIILVGDRVVVFGSVWARDGGAVVDWEGAS